MVGKKEPLSGTGLCGAGGGQSIFMCHIGAPNQLGRPYLWPPEGFEKDAMMHNSRKIFSHVFSYKYEQFLNMNRGIILRMKLLGKHIY